MRPTKDSITQFLTSNKDIAYLTLWYKSIHTIYREEFLISYPYTMMSLMNNMH